MTGSAADGQLRRLPPLCLDRLEPPGVLPGGVPRVSSRLARSPLHPGHRHPPSRRPPPSARDARAPPGAQSCGESEAAVAAAAAASSSPGRGGGVVIRSPEPLTGEDEAFMLELTSGKLELLE